MNIQLLIAGALLSVSCIGGLGYMLRQAWATNGEQSARIETLLEASRMAARARVRDQAISTALQARKAAVGRSEALAGQALEAAKAANPEWSSQPLPKEVQDALE
jgi:hypothetical protein